MKRILMVMAIACVLASTTVFAAPAPKKILSQSSLDKFMKAIPLITKDLDSLELSDDYSLDATSEDGSFSIASLRESFGKMKTVKEINAVLKKYGWNETFWDTYAVVMSCFFVITMDMMVEQMGESYRAQADTKEFREMKASVHADDLALVRKNFDALSGVMESVGSE